MLGGLTGNCRTSFHPLCAREAQQRMEVWARNGSDTVSVLFFFFPWVKTNPVSLFVQNKNEKKRSSLVLGTDQPFQFHSAPLFLITSPLYFVLGVDFYVLLECYVLSG